MTGGIALPTVTLEHVRAAVSRLGSVVPPLVAMDRTLNCGVMALIDVLGNVSVNVNVSPRVMAFEPEFVTLTVQTTLSPAFTVVGETLFAITKLYWQGIQSIVTEPFGPKAATPPAAWPPTEPATAVGVEADTMGDVAAKKLEPPPPPPPVLGKPAPVVDAPPPPPV